MIESAIRKFCAFVARGRAARHIPGKSGRDIYLSRYFLLPPIGPDEHAAMNDPDRPDKTWGVFLHHFLRSDEDQELHNHPWDWGFALILTGGYVEERRAEDAHGYRIDVKACLPGSFNIIRANDYHRVELYDPKNGAWTIFVHGKRVQDWSFWSRLDNRVTPWRTFIVERAAEYRERLENEAKSDAESALGGYKRWNAPAEEEA